MKVKDFKEILEDFDPESEVFTYDFEYGYRFLGVPKGHTNIEIKSMNLDDQGKGEWTTTVYKKGIVL